MRLITERGMVECPAPHRKYPERICGGNIARVAPNTFVWIRMHDGSTLAGCIYHKCRHCHSILEMHISTEAA